MKDYSYIGVAEDILGDCSRFVVRSTEKPIRKGDIVVFRRERTIVQAEVLHSAFLRVGCDEEAMLAEFGEICEVEKIYNLYWEKDEEVTEDGN